MEMNPGNSKKRDDFFTQRFVVSYPRFIEQKKTERQWTEQFNITCKLIGINPWTKRLGITWRRAYPEYLIRRADVLNDSQKSYR